MGAAITKFVWDGNTPLHEWVETETEKVPSGDLGAITWVFDADSFVPSAKLQGNKSYSIVSDYLGTPCQAYSETGAKVWEYEQKSYGGVETLQGAINFVPFRYQGQYEDVETGLYYNRFRYYSPDEGSYISQDPIGLRGGLLLYGYVKDSNYWIDPFGLIVTPTYTRGIGGRIESANATITTGDLGKGTATNPSSRASARAMGDATDDAGHVIGKQLGGSGGVGHVFPQDLSVNRGVVARFEGEVAGMVRTHGSVNMTVTFHYDGNSTRPKGVTYTAVAPNGTTKSTSFLNPH